MIDTPRSDVFPLIGAHFSDEEELTSTSFGRVFVAKCTFPSPKMGFSYQKRCFFL